MRIAGYAYQAETLCPTCTVLSVTGAGYPTKSTYEATLDDAAQRLGIDRYDERTFDSDDFPKVIFAIGVAADETCDRCARPLG